MQLDKRSIDRLLTMNDRALEDFVRRVASESGIDPRALGLNIENIQALRTALSTATEEDLRALTEVYHAYKQNNRP